jgi:hypothetical protein
MNEREAPMSQLHNYQEAERELADAQFEWKEACRRRRYWGIPTTIGFAWLAWAVYAAINISAWWVLGILGVIGALAISYMYWENEIADECPIARRNVHDASLKYRQAAVVLTQSEIDRI